MSKIVLSFIFYEKEKKRQKCFKIAEECFFFKKKNKKIKPRQVIVYTFLCFWASDDTKRDKL